MAQNTYTGFHAVEERVRHYGAEKKHSATLRLCFSKPGPRIKKIIALAKEYNIPCEQLDDKALDAIVKHLPQQAQDHRGIVLIADGEKEKTSNFVQLDQWLSCCPEHATVVVLDNVTDPHNVGAIIRSLDQFGASLLVIPERHSASDIQDNEIIARSSAGSSAYVNVSIVTNLARSVEMLKESGFWIYGADADGSPLQKTHFDDKTCIIMGSEGSGISRLLTQQCDAIVSIPTCGKIDSLNVSVATGVLLYERHRQELL